MAGSDQPRRDTRARSGDSNRTKRSEGPRQGGGWKDRKDRPFEGEVVDRTGWGGVARRGAAKVDPARGRRSGIQPPKPLPEDDDGVVPTERRSGLEPPTRQEWILEGVEHEASRAVRRGAKKPSRAASTPKNSQASESKRHESTGEGGFAKAVSPPRAKRLSQKLHDAAKAFDRERYVEVVSMLRPVVREAPSVVEARELLGLSYYRLGRWKEALRELKAFHTQTGSTEQHPVLADCARALGRHDEVRTYWDELCEVSPGADLVAEGRIVMAGSLADQGRLDEGVALLAKGRKSVKHPQERHLRLAYALADLQERAGDVPAARRGFQWLDEQSPGFGDVRERLASLR